MAAVRIPDRLLRQWAAISLRQHGRTVQLRQDLEQVAGFPDHSDLVPLADHSQAENAIRISEQMRRLTTTVTTVHPRRATS